MRQVYECLCEPWVTPKQLSGAAKQRPELSRGRGFAALGYVENNCPMVAAPRLQTNFITTTPK
jgi:hypothetical protein